MQTRTIIDQVWAYMFANGRTYKEQVIDGKKISNGYTRLDIEKMSIGFIGPVVDGIVLSNDWDFAVAVATTVSIVGTTQYELEGNDADARSIINVRYGPGRGRVLEQKNTLESDRRLSTRNDDNDNDGTVSGYTKFGRSEGGFPQIQLLNTPTTVETIRYRYHKIDVGLAQLPDSFNDAVFDGLLAKFDINLRSFAVDSLNKIRADYDPGGDEYSTMRKDPVIERGNQRRAAMSGGA